MRRKYQAVCWINRCHSIETGIFIFIGLFEYYFWFPLNFQCWRLNWHVTSSKSGNYSKCSLCAPWNLVFCFSRSFETNFMSCSTMHGILFIIMLKIFKKKRTGKMTGLCLNNGNWQTMAIMYALKSTVCLRWR